MAGFGDFSTRANETDMLMRDSNNGNFEVYDISNNTITFAAPMGQVGMEWTIAGFGDFSGRANETDMLMRNSNTGAFEVYDISNNTITFATGMGQVGLEWTIAGFGDFSGNANETDMLLRNSNTGAFEVYDISNNQITYAAGMGQVGLEWQVAGFGDLSSGAGETDMLMRNSNTGAFEVLRYRAQHDHRRRARWARSEWNGRWPASPVSSPGGRRGRAAACAGHGILCARKCCADGCGVSAPSQRTQGATKSVARGLTAGIAT